MSDDLDHLDHLARESERFADVLAAIDLSRPVPTCPDWTASDLFWHLTEVQWFWGTIVRERLTSPEATQGRRPERPTDLDALVHLYSTVSESLHATLASTPPQTAVWTWADEQTVAFIRRRQAHEALIHRYDAEVTAGAVTGIDPALASDGVDEALRVMHGGVPGWGGFEPDGSTARVVTTDTGAGWTLRFGHFTGTDPESRKHHDESVFEVTDDDSSTTERADAVVRGTAADLDCWVWGRLAADRVQRTGDDAVLARLQSVVDGGID